MSGAVGPRVLGHPGGRRAPVSFNDAELLALAGYRSAYRGLKRAMAHEREAVNENRSAYALEAARAATEAAIAAHRKALETLNASIEEA